MANAEKLKKFQEAIKSIDKNISKQYDTDGSITIFGDDPKDVEVISSGSIVLDDLLGGGLAKGRVIEIFGPEASGKTSLALTAIGNVQKEGGTAAFIDLENALDPRYAGVLGVDMDNLAISQPTTGEEALDMLEELVRSAAVDIIALDSIAALVPKAELEGTMEDQQMGTTAKLLGKGLRRILKPARENNCTVILINQLREKVGFFMGSPEVTPGGKAPKYFASQRIDIRRIGQVTEPGSKSPIGTEVKIKIIKNKVAPPFREGKTVLTFAQGISKAAELVEIGPKVGAIYMPTTRSWNHPVTHEKFAGSKAEALEALQTDEQLFNDIVQYFSEIMAGQHDDEDAEIINEEDYEDAALEAAE